MTIARTDLKAYRKMHTPNYAQSRAIDRWLKIAQDPKIADPYILLNHRPIFRPIPGTSLTYDHVLRKWFNQRKSAHKRGIQFALTPTSIMNMLRAKKCHYSGIKLTPGARPGEQQKLTDFSIDRIDSSKGYIPGNVVACCRAVNEMKSYLESRGENPTPEQMKIIVETAREVVYNVH
jgi:hypothetical protein